MSASEALGHQARDYVDLAQAAIDMAIAGGGDQKKIDRALKEMDKAADERAKGHSHHAIDHYKKAWAHAVKAL